MKLLKGARAKAHMFELFENELEHYKYDRVCGYYQNDRGGFTAYYFDGEKIIVARFKRKEHARQWCGIKTPAGAGKEEVRQAVNITSH